MKIIIGLVVVLAVVFGIIFIGYSNIFKARKATEKKSPIDAKALQAQAKTPAKKTFSKDMGGLTVKIRDINNKDIYLRMSAYKSIDKQSSVYSVTFASNRMQELLSGTYDLQIETVPFMYYKGIEVSREKETVKDLGSVMGAVNVKLANYEKKDISIPVKIMHQRSRAHIVSGMTNRPITILPGTYDLEINTMPRQSKNDVKVEAGKEALLGPGYSMGAIIVKALDENNKEVRLSVRIKKADTGEVVGNVTANRSADIMKGTYTIELLSSPIQIKKDVVVEAGSQSAVGFTVQVPQKTTVKK